MMPELPDIGDRDRVHVVRIAQTQALEFRTKSEAIER